MKLFHKNKTAKFSNDSKMEKLWDLKELIQIHALLKKGKYVYEYLLYNKKRVLVLRIG
jgi:hypothetical protein